MQNPSPEPLPILFLYAEIHFRFFSKFPSLLYKKEPEVIFDLPRRVDPGCDLPVVLIVNDIHHYPVSLGEVAITVSGNTSEPRSEDMGREKQKNTLELFRFNEIEKYEIKHSLSDQLRAFIFEIPRSKLTDGEILVNAMVSITRGKKRWHVINDNLFSSSKLPFKCRISSKRLPGSDLCTYGDLHTHSIYSRSHVEFGPPLKVYEKIAGVSGLDFLGITDHSYDLACRKDDYLKQDRSLSKWRMLKEEIPPASLIKRSSYEVQGSDNPPRPPALLILGEEISCLNKEGNVVHLCGLGLRDFIGGTLDGARRNTVFSRQLTIPEVIKEIHGQGGVAFAAHPGSQAGFLQRIFLHRGAWSQMDNFDALDGFQALNSGYRKSWNRAKSLWIDLLRKGLRIPLLGGNDAHGDFNRYRALNVPFISIYEDSGRFMGFGKTGVYGKKNTVRDILDSIRKGATFVTTGPFISIGKSSSPKEAVISNTSLSLRNTAELAAYAGSTSEFGRLLRLSIIMGGPSRVEKPIVSKSYKEIIHETMEFLPSIDIADKCYLRAEVVSMLDDGTTFEAYSSPCYFDI